MSLNCSFSCCHFIAKNVYTLCVQLYSLLPLSFPVAVENSYSTVDIII